MNRRSGLRLFAGVTGLMLVWALMVMEQRGRPRDQIERPSGPSAVEEGGQNDNPNYRGLGFGVRGSNSGKPHRTPNPEPRRPLVRPGSSKRPPAKRTADASSGEGAARKQVPVVAPPQRNLQPSRVPPGLPEVAVPQLSESPPADDPPPAAPPSETSDPGLSPPPPPVLKPPVLLTEPTQDGGDQQVALERGQLTTQLRLEAREGRVVMRILVRTDGTVARAEVARSSGQSALDQAAVLAVGSWRFDPATRNGAAIEAWVLIPVRFVVR
jgi:protein TonB